MPAHVTLSQASLPALFNRAVPAGPVPNLSKSVFQQIIGSKGREVSLLFLPVCLYLCSVFSNLASLIPYLLKYAVKPKKIIDPKTQAVFLVRQGWPKANECETSGDGEREFAHVRDERLGLLILFEKTRRA